MVRESLQRQSRPKPLGKLDVEGVEVELADPLGLQRAELVDGVGPPSRPRPAGPQALQRPDARMISIPVVRSGPAHC